MAEGEQRGPADEAAERPKRAVRSGAYARIEETLIARAERGADGEGFDPVLALNLLKLRRTERSETAADGQVTQVPIAVVQDALLKRLASIAGQEGQGDGER